MDLKLILEVIVNQYALPVSGIYGVNNWARVLENGVRLSEETGANSNVVRLFA